MSMTAETVQHIRQNDPVDIESFQVFARRQRISGESAVMKLDIEYKELNHSWKCFQDFVPLNERLVLDQRPQGHADAILVAEQAMQFWISSKNQYLFQNCLNLAREFVDTVEAHSILMRALPDSKDYSTLFYSVVESIIKASTKQYRVVEGFLASLIQINRAVLSAIKENEVPYSSHRVASLYCQIFLFLGEFMNFYIARGVCRLLYSHNEDFKCNFQNLVRRVHDSAVTVTNGSAGDRPGEPMYKHLRRSSSELLDDSRLEQAGLEGAARRQAASTAFVRMLIWNVQQNHDFRQKLSVGRERMLNDFLSELRHRVRDFEVGPNQGWVDISQDDSSTQCYQSVPSKSNSRRRLLKLLLQRDSRDLEDWFDNDDQIQPFDSDQQLSISSGTAAALREWTRTLRSQPLVISGPHVIGLPDGMTLISASYVSLARRMNIPVVAHFCARALRPTKESGLIAVVYSLIRQLIELAPPMLDCDYAWDLSGDQFRRLNGTMASWKEALAVLDTLLYFAPPLLFCVIDGMDLLEDTSTKEYVRPLVDILVSHTARHRTSIASRQNINLPDTLLKVLFTTGGQSSALREALGKEHAIVTENADIDAGHTQPATDLDIVMEGL